MMHIQFRVISASLKEVKNGLSLKELTVKDDGKTIMTLIVFGDMIERGELNSRYRISDA